MHERRNIHIRKRSFVQKLKSMDGKDACQQQQGLPLQATGTETVRGAPQQVPESIRKEAAAFTCNVHILP